MSFKIPSAQEKARGGADVWCQCASVVMAPWREWSVEKDAYVKMPEIMVDPFASGADMTEGVTKHDPLMDNIVVLMDPKAAEHLLNGMGLGGIFVQLVPVSQNADSSQQKNGLGVAKGKKKKSGLENKPFWYFKEAHQILTSFHTERTKMIEE